MTVTSPAPDRPQSRPGNRARPSRNLAPLAIAWGMIGILLSLSLPFAPVLSDRTTVDWGGAEPARSTTAFFVPNRPADLAVTVPCAAVRAGSSGPVERTVFATAVGASGAQPAGLVVQGGAGELRVLVNGRQVQAGPVPAGACDLTVTANSGGVTGTLGGAPAFELPGEPVPDVYAFVTDLTRAESTGLAATARTHTWFESKPTALKLLLLIAAATFSLGSILLLNRLVGRREPGATRDKAAQQQPWWRPNLLADLGVFGALGAWAFVGPQTSDDGYATMTIRNAGNAGDIGNYFHWFNASEAPFTLVQQIARPLTEVSVAPVWLRLPSLLLAAATWLMLTRGILPAAGARFATGGWIRLVAGLVFLAWWLPFGIGMRPEPYIAFLSASTLFLLMRGTSDGVRNPGLWLGGAALSAGLAVTVTPTFVVALAPVLAFLPRMWRTLQAGFAVRSRESWTTLAAQVGLLGSIAAVAVPIIFADQSLFGVRQATELHRDIGPNLHWYEEFVRYNYLLGHSDQGNALKRLAVLVTIALLVTVVVTVARRRPEQLSVVQLTSAAGLAYLLLWLTPSKWSHHFGSLAGLAVPFVVVGTVHLVDVARTRAAEPGVRKVAVAGSVAVALAVGVAFSGPNLWYGYGVLGVPWLEGPIQPLGIPIDNPAVWIVGAAAAVGVVWWRHPSRREVALALTPAALGVVALSLGAVLLTGTFAVATARQVRNDGFSIGETNVHHVLDSDCGIADDVTVADGPLRALPATTAADELNGFVLNGGLPAYLTGARPLTLAPTDPLWGSGSRGDAGAGSLASRWFELPREGTYDQIAVPMTGQVDGPNEVSLEFGRAADSRVDAVGVRRVVTSPVLVTDWREGWVSTADMPAGADRVRVRATDTSTAVGGSLAVGAPRSRAVTRLEGILTSGPGPVIVDWPISWWFPCVEDVPSVAHGLAAAPRIRVGGQSREAEGLDIIYNPGKGGSFAGLLYTGARAREISSELIGSPGYEWGHLILLDYPGLAVDAYRVSHDEVRIGGNEGDE